MTARPRRSPFQTPSEARAEERVERMRAQEARIDRAFSYAISAADLRAAVELARPESVVILDEAAETFVTREQYMRNMREAERRRIFERMRARSVVPKRVVDCWNEASEARE